MLSILNASIKKQSYCPKTNHTNYLPITQIPHSLTSLKYILFLPVILSCFGAFAQDVTMVKPRETEGALVVDSAKQRDIIDVIQKLFNGDTSPEKRLKPKKANFSIIPYVGYSLSTGFVADIAGNVSFFTTAAHRENRSVIASDISYDSNEQKSFLTRSEIWGKENSFKVVSDLRIQRYPTETYGLGTSATFDTDDHLDFMYLRVYETFFARITGSFYGGMGYNLDHHYNIIETGNADGSVSDFIKYGQAAESTSSGVNLGLLFDNRTNTLNPLGGDFASVIFRQNLTVLSSDANWESLQFDFRKYMRLSSYSNNILAIWTMATFTRGNVPYLDLPSTSADMYNNSGRGYAIGRFRGRNMLYFEAEYRFGITDNGLLGGVAFANGQSFSEFGSNAFMRVAPAAGAGIRIKVNKHSNSNICIDYGVGTGGSRGFFVNLGEVF